MDIGELVVDGGATHIGGLNKTLPNYTSSSKIYIVAGGGRTEALIMDIGIQITDIEI